MKLRTLLACLCAWAVALGAGGFWLVRSPADAAPPLGLDGFSAARAAPVPVIATEAQLAQTSRIGAAPVPTPAKPNEAAAPKSSGVRLQCILTDAETGEPLPGASVFVEHESPSNGRLRSLSQLLTDGAGLAHLSLAGLTDFSMASQPEQHLRLQVLASGYAPKSEHVSVNTREDLVINVEIELETVQCALFGRAVDAYRQPIMSAKVTAAVWGPLGENAELQSEETDTYGYFRFPLQTVGRVDLMVGHPAHGTQHAQALVGMEDREIDVGDVVLLPSGLEVSGRVVAIDGTPLPGAALTLNPPKDVGDSVRRVRSEADGTFTFQSLGPWAYQLGSPLKRKFQPMPPGNQSNFVVRASGPTAKVRIFAPDGTKISDPYIGFSRLRREGAHVMPEDGRFLQVWDFEGDFLVFAESPGLHLVSFTHHLDGTRYRASKLVDLDERHRLIDLHIKPEELHAVPIRVVGPGGEAIENYSHQLRSLDEGNSLWPGNENAAKLFAPAGWLNIRTTPAFPSFVLPFETVVEVHKDMQTIVLQGKEIGGHLRLQVSLDGEGARLHDVRLGASNGQIAGSPDFDDNTAYTQTPVPAGTYKWSIGSRDHESGSKLTTAQAGEIIQERLHMEKQRKRRR